LRQFRDDLRALGKPDKINHEKLTAIVIAHKHLEVRQLLGRKSVNALCPRGKDSNLGFG
jgi:hypothetical protein